MPEATPTAEDAALALEVYQRQLDAVSRQLELLQAAHDDASRAKKTLEGLSDEKSLDVLLPIGASTFLRGTLEKEDRIISGIGAGYATERKRADAIKRLSEREAALQGEMERFMQAAVQLQQEAARIQERLEPGGMGTS